MPLQSHITQWSDFIYPDPALLLRWRWTMESTVVEQWQSSELMWWSQGVRE